MADGHLGTLLVAAHFLAPRPLGVMTSRIESLIQQLDGEAGESYDARAELIWIGSEAIPAVIDGLPALGGFGQLTAIEVFEEVADPRCGPALIGLLDSDNPTVREWAAMTLASLKIEGASEPLRRTATRGPSHLTGPSPTASAGPHGTRCPHPCRPTAHRAPMPRRWGWRSGLAHGPLHRDHQ
ncbi:HEAT repeat domain-containing protein [Streptomyces sp. NPDC056653]|uniref:HEAT repeat domain-containing protein n=1 Tax=Streptomyces sp. NPDC056653 TaxID=3345894 RepID=UPI003676B580